MAVAFCMVVIMIMIVVMFMFMLVRIGCSRRCTAALTVTSIITVKQASVGGCFETVGIAWLLSQRLL